MEGKEGVEYNTLIDHGHGRRDKGGTSILIVSAEGSYEVFAATVHASMHTIHEDTSIIIIRTCMPMSFAHFP